MYIQTRNFGYKKSVITVYEDENCNRIPRIHQFSEIQCVLKGSFYITVNKETVLAKEGDIAVITPFLIHGVKAAEPESELWICGFANDFVSDFIPNELALEPKETSVYTPPRELFDYIKLNMFDTYEKVISLENDEARFRKIKALIYAVFESYMSSVPQKKLELKIPALATLILYLSEHFKEDLTRKSVSKAIGYSESHISHSIEILPDMSFRKLLNSLRTEYGKKLLVSTDFNILKIALECGFSNDRTFYRSFVELEGISPGEYRKKYRTDP